MLSKLLLAVALVGPFTVGNADDLVFQGDPNGIPIARLIEQAQQVTGEPFFFDMKDVADQKVHFAGDVTVARDRFLPFFDLCLRESDFVHLERVVAGRTMHSIRKLGQQARGQQALKAAARAVTLEELRGMADRQTLVTTVFQTKNLPARELVTTISLYFADSATESIRNIEGTDAIVMTGFATNVAALVGMAERLDVAVGTSPESLSARALERRVAVLEQIVAKLQEGGAKPAGK